MSNYYICTINILWFLWIFRKYTLLLYILFAVAALVMSFKWTVVLYNKSNYKELFNGMRPSILRGNSNSNATDSTASIVTKKILLFKNVLNNLSRFSACIFSSFRDRLSVTRFKHSQFSKELKHIYVTRRECFYHFLTLSWDIENIVAFLDGVLGKIVFGVSNKILTSLVTRKVESGRRNLHVEYRMLLYILLVAPGGIWFNEKITVLVLLINC